MGLYVMTDGEGYIYHKAGSPDSHIPESLEELAQHCYAVNQKENVSGTHNLFFYKLVEVSGKEEEALLVRIAKLESQS